MEGLNLGQKSFLEIVSKVIVTYEKKVKFRSKHWNEIQFLNVLYVVNSVSKLFSLILVKVLSFNLLKYLQYVTVLLSYLIVTKKTANHFENSLTKFNFPDLQNDRIVLKLQSNFFIKPTAKYSKIN